MLKRTPLILLILALSGAVFAQSGEYSRADSLRGALRPERTAYDVTYYNLDIKVDPATKTISGSNIIQFTALEDFTRLQIDLFDNMKIDGIYFSELQLKFFREFNAVFIDFPDTVKKGTESSFKVLFSGAPQAAKRPPWDGGFVWRQDKNGNPWVGVACEGTGASCWWPLKDYLGDEPEGMRISTTVPDSLMSVSNGRLIDTTQVAPGWKKWTWEVSYPINSYNATVNIADYVQIHDTFVNASGVHDLDYYVLRYNEKKARKQFEQVKPMMKCYEQLFGEYPFWKDGYALVETPYLGMEHQGAIAYGNGYKPGYAGYDPLGLKFDYIVIHETGHEWWGNSVSCEDHAELWIHESFCTYSEALYVECLWDYETSVRYLVNQRSNIVNGSPLVGALDVNFQDWVGSDIYYKGAWMLHTIRNLVDSTAQWKDAIYHFAKAFELKNTNTEEIIQWFNDYLDMDLTKVFRQYLYYPAVPVFEYKLKGKKLQFRWKADVEDFDMRVRIRTAKDTWEWVQPTPEWQKIKVDVKPEDFDVDRESFLVKVREVD